MRLSKIKIAGFKSFVDPISIEMRGNLTGIVGPNGCGKSNTIDAVRWVMGESSAKHLRGASMDDVIFNGSSSRKPIGQASIELLFDNSNARLGGEYAKFSEIGIKRQIHRDGQSKYFLNGTRCRRRDITDIFLGTGLGPRSYAIIEQGTISRLIEAKPEELRTTIEEAAGISKYKERRRETETRIRHTRENLERLSDLRDEMEKQITHLKRQANAAEKFKTFKASERQISAELIILRLQKVDADLLKSQDKINESATSHQAKLAEQRSLENQIETQREAHSDANNAFNKVQANFYQTGSEISRLEQTIQHQETLRQRFTQELQQLKDEILATNQHVEEDKAQLESANKALEVLEPQQEHLQDELLNSRESLRLAEMGLSKWKQTWSALQNRLAEPTQLIQLERVRLEQLDGQIQKNANRLLNLQNEQKKFDEHSNDAELEAQQKQLSILQEQHLNAKSASEDHKQALQTQRNYNQESQQALQQAHAKLQSLKGKLSSLEILQKAGLGKDDGRTAKTLRQWLTKHDLQNSKQLAESIQVETGWEKAFETVLGDLLKSRQIQSHDQLQNLMRNAPDISASFLIAEGFDTKTIESTTQASNNFLDSKLISPITLRPLLSSILYAENIDDAMALQKTLKAHQTIVTKDGTVLGENWLKLQAKNNSNQREGVLARQKEIDASRNEMTELTDLISDLEETHEQGLDDLKKKESLLTQQQVALNTLHREESQAQSRISATENKIKQIASNKNRIIKELAELILQQESEQQTQKKASALHDEAVLLLETLEQEQIALKGTDIPLQDALYAVRKQVQETRNSAQEVQLQLESEKVKKANAQKQLARFEERFQQLNQREERLVEQNASANIENIEALQNSLNKQLEQRKNIDKALTDARNQLQSIDNDVRNLEANRHQAEQAVEEFRTQLEKLKLEWQEISVRQETLKEQFDETEFDYTELEQLLDESATLASQQQALELMQRKVSRLGAINLAAIDEFKTQSDRKEYLDQQNDDLIEALDTLETAIAKIDRETKSLFKDTFEKVNIRIQEMFPQLFGGGKAHLELTGDDLLTTGISIMAQPPGKRLSSIHLMSGGEKALTAIALVFAIFELNPAPFCMLDEVDAPLDEANVGRFCALVKKMSDHVQFIFITHNKTTMELADNLIGVTMREAGVSRLVSVDINEASRMTQE